MARTQLQKNWRCKKKATKMKIGKKKNKEKQE
jgi:hypothetical protein